MTTVVTRATGGTSKPVGVLYLEPARRLAGCLGDLQMDRVLARVISVESTP